MSKFLYIPIWYKDILLDVMFSIGQLGELFELPSDSLFRLGTVTKGEKTKYMTKFTVYMEKNNIFQAVPLSSLLLTVSYTFSPHILTFPLDL